jgi:hypothetical protein
MGYSGSQPLGIYETPVQIAARKKAEADAAKRAKALAALQTKSLGEAKKKAALDKASKTLNLEAINIEAALKGKISETDRLSLLLQKAILEGNDTVAAKLAADLEAANKKNADLQAALLATPEAPNPYRNWKAPDMGPKAMAGSVTGGGYGGLVPNFNVPEYAKDSYSQYGPLGGLGAGVIAGVNPQVNVVVTLDGNAVTGAITETQVNQSLSGTFSDVNRVASRGSVSIR